MKNSKKVILAIAGLFSSIVIINKTTENVSALKSFKELLKVESVLPEVVKPQIIETKGLPQIMYQKTVLDLIKEPEVKSIKFSGPSPEAMIQETKVEDKPKNTPEEWDDCLSNPNCCSEGSNLILSDYRNNLPNILPTEEVRTQTFPGNRYAIGQCTWYVYNRMSQLGLKCHPLLGNGGSWARSGPAHGQRVDSEPHENWAVCFVPNTNGASYYGHIAFVEKVNPNGAFLISEMNHNGGLHKIYWRTMSVNSGLSFVSPQE